MRVFVFGILIMFAASCSFKSIKDKTFINSMVVSNEEEKKIIPFFYNNYLPTFDSIKVAYNVIKSENFNHFVDVFFISNNDTIHTLVERSGYMYNSNDNIFVDIYDNTGFIVWVTEPFYNSQLSHPDHCYELHFRSLNIKTGKVFFSNKIFSTKCFIDRLSIKYNPFTNSILIAYNDFSRPDSRYLMYGFLSLKNHVPVNKDLSPIEINLHDNSEKRFPQFLKNKSNVYLYHTTGDNWGMFSYSGKQQIAISLIDKNNKPAGYKIINDSNAINERILLINDTIYFTTRIENKGKPDGMQMKKAALYDL